MDLGLSGKVVVITGGSAGIGKACALAFAAEGCKLAVCGRGADKLTAMKREFEASRYPLFTSTADVSQEQDVERFALEVNKHYGRIDVWLNNAGTYLVKPIVEMSADEWDDHMRTNLKSVFLGTKAAARYMKPNGGGVILNASSYAAVIPSAGTGAYAASKSAILSLTRATAGELAPFGIRVNAYIPGVILTELNRERAQKFGPQLKAQVAQHRLGEPEEIAPAVVFLASSAANYVTGTAMEISGGKLAIQNPDAPWAWVAAEAKK